MTRATGMTRASVAAFLIALAWLSPGSAAAKAPGTERCVDKVLTGSEGGADTDLEVRGPCEVRAGIHKYRNVHVLDGGTLRFLDAKIDFWATAILVEKGGSLIAGSAGAPIKGPLTIHLYGQDQTGVEPTRRGTGVRCKSQPVETCGAPETLFYSNMKASDRHT
ncbi:MAG: G8 domain-containing protein, partial [Candidatus Rokuibacteriota bacterium]